MPGLAYKIHQANPSADLKINLKGVAIGDGLCDPVNVRMYILCTLLCYLHAVEFNAGVL